MRLFFENACKIFEAAESALESGLPPSDMSILVGRSGGIHMIAGSDWPLASLLAHHGAEAAYRVTESGGKVQLDAKCPSQTLRMGGESPAAVASRVLADRPMYLI